MDVDQLFSQGPWPDGEIAADWQASPLGHPHTWCPSLQRAVRRCLGSHAPAALCWGRDLALVWNPAWSRAFPASPSHLIGRPLDESLPDLHAALAPALPELFAAGAGPRRESVSLVVNGTVPARAVTLEVQPLQDEDGRTGGLMLCASSLPASTPARPVTPDLERLLASIGDGFVVLDHDLRYSYVNDAALRMTGFTREQVIGRAPQDILPPDLLAVAIPQLREAMRRGRAVQYEAHMAATGRWFEHRVYPSGDSLCVSFSDITDRKQSEEALRRSEAAYRLIVSLNDAIRGLQDPDAIVSAVVACAGRHFGVGRCFYGELDASGVVTTRREYCSGGETVIGRHQLSTLGELIARDLREGRTVAIGDVTADPRLTGSEAAGRYSQMAVRSLVAAPLLQGGRLAALFIIDDPRPRTWSHADLALIDQVAERLRLALEHAGAAADLARAHDAAAADADRLSVALHAARLGTWSWSSADNLVHLSERAQELYGLDRPYTTREEIRLLIHPDDRERSRELGDRPAVSRADYTVEYRVTSARGERWLSVSGRGRYDGAGRLTAMLGVVHDISHDRLLVRLDDLVRSLSDPEEITAMAARVLGRFLQADRCAYAVTDAAETQFHVSGNYTVGVTSLVGSYPLDHLGLEPLRLFWSGQPWVSDDTAADGRLAEPERAMYRDAEIGALVCAPILKGGRLVAVMAVHSAVPRRWEPGEVDLVRQVASRCWESLERARVERERVGLLEAAEAANRAKDEFLAMLGHELRNPLAPIMTALQLMKLRLGDAASRERTVIERQIAHLTRLVDDLLDVSRIARGKVELKCERVELADLVARAIEVASPLLEQRAHTLEVSVPRDGLVLDADPARLAQVIGNLLTNAAKYTPAGGRVSIAAAADEGTVVLRVRDTGIGIAPDVLPRVFDLFVQGHQGLDRAQGGLGLGLTIARSLVERHGGAVQACSEGLGLGSEFVVRLPRAAEPTSVVAPIDLLAPAAVATRGRGHVLIVDDNEDAAEMLAAALQARGFVTHTAHDGLQALDILSAVRPAAALLDIGLPVMDSYELAGRLRQVPALAEMRLIAVTGYGQESDRLRAREAGFHHHMVKPVDLDCLYGLLDDVVPVGGSPAG